MWSSILEWAKKNPLFAVIIVVASIAVLSGAVDGISARRAATRYFDLAKGWAAAYSRDTTATKKAYEERIRILTSELNADETTWENAKGNMNRPWTPPKGAKALQERFKAAGYGGRVTR